MASSPSKHPRLSSEVKQQDGIDHLSNLPDSVLCHILSFLETEEAVATTVLSKRWVDLWTQVPVLVFRALPFYFTNDSPFVKFVSNALLKSNAQSTRKFSLDMYVYSTFDVRVLGTWVEEAARRNLEEMSLNFKFYGGRYVVDVFDSLSACKTLASLELAIHIFVDVPAKIHLPCLRVLKLKKVKYANDDTLRRLISSCPVLEDLTLERTAGDNIVALDINVASVKRITVSGCACDGEIDPSCKLLIKGPLLERIDLNVKGYSDFLIEDASNLAVAKIEVGEVFYEHQFFKLLTEIANVRFLCLVPSSIWSVCPPKAKFPTFHNLVSLDIQCCCVYRHGLMALLEYSDNLEQLVYHNVELHQRKCDQALVGSVPKCVSMRLKSVNFRRLTFNFNHCDWTLPRYFLTNAKFLKQMKIGISPCRVKKNRRLYLGNLLKYPRASVACEIGFFRESTKKEINLGPE